jgi:hypothetical protein
MEDKKIQELYKLAVSKGLNRTYDEFVRLSIEDEQKRKQVYDLAVGAGYRHDFDTFGELFGIQKKKNNNNLSKRDGRSQDWNHRRVKQVWSLLYLQLLQWNQRVLHRIHSLKVRGTY